MAQERGQFSSKLGFILAAAGSAVGLGNLVAFPVMASKNGGAAFLIIYLLFIAFICYPVMMAFSRDILESSDLTNIEEEREQGRVSAWARLDNSWAILTVVRLLGRSVWLSFFR